MRGGIEYIERPLTQLRNAFDLDNRMNQDFKELQARINKRNAEARAIAEETGQLYTNMNRIKNTWGQANKGTLTERVRRTTEELNNYKNKPQRLEPGQSSSVFTDPSLERMSSIETHADMTNLDDIGYEGDMVRPADRGTIQGLPKTDPKIVNRLQKQLENELQQLEDYNRKLSITREFNKKVNEYGELTGINWRKAFLGMKQGRSKSLTIDASHEALKEKELLNQMRLDINKNRLQIKEYVRKLNIDKWRKLT